MSMRRMLIVLKRSWWWRTRWCGWSEMRGGNDFVQVGRSYRWEERRQTMKKDAHGRWVLESITLLHSYLSRRPFNFNCPFQLHFNSFFRGLVEYFFQLTLMMLSWWGSSWGWCGWWRWARFGSLRLLREWWIFHGRDWCSDLFHPSLISIELSLSGWTRCPLMRILDQREWSGITSIRRRRGRGRRRHRRMIHWERGRRIG